MKRSILALMAVLLVGVGAWAQVEPVESGLTLRVWRVGREIDGLMPIGPGQTPNVDRRIDVIDLADADAFGGPKNYFYAEVSGYLVIDAAGWYEFSLTSDDGSRLTIGDEVVIDHDGRHAAEAKAGRVELDVGSHAIVLSMFENTNQESLRLEWKPAGADEFLLVPAPVFRTEKGVTRVVSPGDKLYMDGRQDFKHGDGLVLDGVHPGWVVEDIRPEGFEPQVGGMAFLPDGRLLVSTFKPMNNGELREDTNGSLWVIGGLIGGDASTAVATEIADGFHDPCGIVVVDGDVYVSHRPGIVRLRDADGDGEFETREVFVEPWIGDNYHHFSFGLVEHERWIYGTLSTAIYFENTMRADGVRGEVVSMNGPNPPNRGTVYRVNIDTREVEFLAGGFRTPNGVGVTIEGDVFVADNQGAWLPASKLIHVEEGEFYGHYNGLAASERYPDGGNRSLYMEAGESPPAVWLPQNAVCNSPTTPIEIEDGPFAGQLLLGELTMGGIRRVFLEEVDGEVQGAVFRFTQGFEVGINRMVWGPDGCLYVGGTGANGNWNWKGTQFGLQRLRPTGEDVFEFEEIRATPGGFAILFTEQIDPEWLVDPANYRITQWRYFPTAEYGGPKLDEQRLAVTDVFMSGFGDEVMVSVPGLRAGSVVHIRMDPESVDGDRMWAKEAWYTLNRVPDGPTAYGAIHPLDRGDLRMFGDGGEWGEWGVVGDVGVRSDDHTLLGAVDGTGVAWNGTMGKTVDLTTAFDHGDVRAHIEFMVPEGSNSGVYFQGRYEIQVLDSYGKDEPGHNDCGGIYQRWDPERGAGNEGYEGVAPSSNAARPAGEWQTLDVVFRAPRFDPGGKKIANARFERVELNGVLIHEDVELTGPTRGGGENEVAFGPIRLQGDHGPVAYRNIEIELLDEPAEMPEPEDLSVLVFSKTAGYRHGSIPAGVACVERLGNQAGFAVTATEDASVFTARGLSAYDVVVFMNTSGDVLDDVQQAAFEQWYRAGGGYVGVHAASDTEYGWDWYGDLVGARFDGHPAIQPARIVVVDNKHASTAHLNTTWTRTDEWYEFKDGPHEGCEPLLRVDENTYAGGKSGTWHPLAWRQKFDGGRSFYTAIGHTDESYTEPAFEQHLLGAILWAGE